MSIGGLFGDLYASEYARMCVTHSSSRTEICGSGGATFSKQFLALSLATSIQRDRRKRTDNPKQSHRSTDETKLSVANDKRREEPGSRGRGRIFSIWADGNLRLLHIGT